MRCKPKQTGKTHFPRVTEKTQTIARDRRTFTLRDRPVARAQNAFSYFTNYCHKRKILFTKSPTTMKMCVPILRSAATPAIALLLLLLPAANILSVSAYAAPHHQQIRSFVRSTAGVNNAMTAVGVVSTLAGDWDIAEHADEQTHSLSPSELRQHRQLQLRSAQANHRFAGVVVTPDLELPRHTPSQQQQQPTATESVEMMLGRGSMVAAFALVVNEMVTGQSLPDQICSVVAKILPS